MVRDTGKNRPQTRRAVLSGVAALAAASSPARSLQLCPAPGLLPKSCSAMIDLQRYHSQETFARQLQSEWCWAACVSMICRYHGFHLSQSRIVQQMHGELINKPGDDRLLTDALNRNWEDDDGKLLRTTAQVFSPILDKFNVDNRKVIEDLKNDFPLLCGARKHATVVARADYYDGPDGPPLVFQVHVIDPYPGAAQPPLYARLLQHDETVPVTIGGELRYLASIRVHRD
jgi:hypothetical protein